MDTELAGLFAAPKPASFDTAPGLLTLPETSKPAHISSTRRVVKEAQKTLKADPNAPQDREPESPERLARTLFVGNVAIRVATDKKLKQSLRSLFEAFGEVESTRVRSLVPDKTSDKRIAAITGNICESQDSCCFYVVMRCPQEASKACEALNGTIFEKHHIRVDISSNASQKPASKKSIFIGNLPTKVKDESLWTIFASCGSISNVRVIRDRETGLSKGFGYVTFREKASVELAQQLNGTKCEGRPMRISKCAKPGYQQIKNAHLEKRAEATAKFKELTRQKKQSKDPKASQVHLVDSKQSKPQDSLPRLQATMTSTKLYNGKLSNSGESATKYSEQRSTFTKFQSAPQGSTKHAFKREAVSEAPTYKPVQNETMSKHPAEIRMERKLARAQAPSKCSALASQKPSRPAVPIVGRKPVGPQPQFKSSGKRASTQQPFSGAGKRKEQNHAPSQPQSLDKRKPTNSSAGAATRKEHKPASPQSQSQSQSLRKRTFIKSAATAATVASKKLKASK